MNPGLAWATRALAALAVTLMTAWAALAAYWSDLRSPHARMLLAGLIVLGAGLLFLSSRRKGRALLLFLAGFGVFTLWWSSIAPSNTRHWQPDVALLPVVERNGDTVTVKNIRNFTYTTETDYRAAYYDKTLDLNQLDSLDLVAVYWMGDAIAHVMLSFGFAGKDYLCVSIEARKEIGEGYSSLKGFFKQYELIYVVGDERDLLRLRTDYRDPREDVYLYRTNIAAETIRKLFLEYIEEINTLNEKPQFYNTLTTNCTTNIVRHFRSFSGRITYNWKILFSGYAPHYAYELGGLMDSLPFEELRARSHINPKAHALADAPDFSVRIRKGLP